MTFPLPLNETSRLQALEALEILDTPAEAAFDRITNLAARLFDVPIVLISLLDENRQWFKSCYGLDVRQTERNIAFCSHTILGDEVMVVPDALQDSRFADNPLVTGAPHIRFYAGAPLQLKGSYNLGSLCLIDTRPRQMNEDELATLSDLAALVVDEIELRQAGKLVRDENARRLESEVALRATLEENNRLAAAIKSSTAGVLISDPELPDNPTVFVNPAFTTITGYAPEEIIGHNCRFAQGPETDPTVVEQIRQAIAARKPFFGTLLNYRKDGTPFWNELTINPVFDAEGELINFIGLQTDVTARVEAEAALAKSEKNFRAMIENALDIITTLTPEGIIRYQSPAVQRILGYTPEEMVGRNVFEFVHADDLPLTGSRFAHAAESGEPSPSTEFRFRHKDGTWRHLEAIGRRLNDGPLDITIVVNSRDVTERKCVEEALQASETRYRSVISVLEEGIILHDAHGAIVNANASAERILGRSEAQLQGRTGEDEQWGAVREDGSEFPAEEHPAVVALQTGLPSSHVVMGVRKPDASLIWVTINTQPLFRDHEPTPYAVVTSFSDITEQKRTEERLRLLESVAVNANDAILITEAEPIDLPGPRILYANEAFTRMTGYDLEEIIGQTPRLLQGPDTAREPRDKIRDALSKWKPVVVELLNYRKDGTPFWVELSIVPVADENGWFTHWVSIQRDIDERKRHEAALSAAKEEAERANLAKSEFLSRMSHELRTPLNAILGFGQLLEMDDLSSLQEERLDYMMKGARHLLGLINEVLDIASIEAGRVQLSIEPVSLEDALPEALDLIRPLAAQANIQIREDASMNCNWHILADQQRFKQVLLNLLANAIKYNHAGGELTLSCSLASEHIRVAVTDTGPGIPAEKMTRLFVPFDRLDAETSAVEGTGLGLALSKRLVDAMGGTLTVESEVGQGSTFTIELPCAISPMDQLVQEEVEESTPGLQGIRKRNVLYIEDNLSNLTLIEHLLEDRSEIDLMTAMQGSLGLDLARQHKPDLILLDLHLPDVPGWEVLRQLKADATTGGIPVVVVSADATPPQVQRLLAGGAEGYLTKPLDVKQFFHVLEEALAEEKEV